MNAKRREKMKEKNKTKGIILRIQNKPHYAVIGILIILLVLSILQSFQISKLSSEMEKLRSQEGTTKPDYNTAPVTAMQQIIKEITPTGTPDYGAKAGVSYDKVEESLKKLTTFSTISLSSGEQQRYDTIANTNGTACGYCCGATKLAQNCGCSHNIALQGLTKWLIKNTNYSNTQILNEIRKWHILFFPEPTLKEEIQRRINSGEIDQSILSALPNMVGGC